MFRRPGGDISGVFNAGKGITLTKSGRLRAFPPFRQQDLIVRSQAPYLVLSWR